VKQPIHTAARRPLALNANAADETKRAPAVPDLPPADRARSRGDLAAAVGIGLLCFVLYIIPSAWRPLSETSEARVAVVAREMLRGGDWVVPKLGNEPRFQKPPLPYWLTALAAKVMGPDVAALPSKSGETAASTLPLNLVTEQAAVLPSAMLAALMVFLAIVYGARVHGRAAGVWAGLILGLSGPLFVRWAQFGTGEVPLACFTFAALLAAAWLACAPKPGFLCALALGLALGLAILCKGHIPVLLVLAGLGLEAVRQRSFNLRKVVLFGVALALAAAVVLPWVLAVKARAPEAFQTLFGEAGGGADGMGHLPSNRIKFYFEKLAYGLLPWTPLLLLAWPLAAARLKRERRARPAPLSLAELLERFLWWSAVAGFVGFYLWPKQQIYYLLPLLPPLAVCAGVALSRLNRPGGNYEELLAWIHMAAAVPLAVLLAFVPVFAPAFVKNPDTPIPPLEFTAALGILAVVLVFVAGRMWVEGRPLVVALCLGAVVYVGTFGWTVVKYYHAADRHPLAQEALAVRGQLKQLPPGSRVYAVGLGLSEAELLYYLDRPEIGGIEVLLAETTNAQGQPLPPKPIDPPRFVLCTKVCAEELGLRGAAKVELVQLGLGIQGVDFKRCLEKH